MRPALLSLRPRLAGALRQAALAVAAAGATAGATACATDAPSAVERTRPAALAVLATVPRTSAAAGPAAVRITVAYRRQAGAPVPLGSPQQFALDLQTQAVPVSVDVAPCLADAGRLGTGGAAPAADECNVQLTLEFLLNGVRVDEQVVPSLSMRPGQTATVSQPVALAQVAEVRVVIPAASAQAGGLRLERGTTAALGVQVIDAAGQPITGRPVVWSSANPAVATVTDAGIVTGVSVGATQITAAVAGREVTAATTIVVPTQLITIASAGASGRGRVVSVPAGLDCTMDGATTTGSCAARFPSDASVQLTATAGANADFFAFTGDCAEVQGATCSVTPTTARRVTVSFRTRQGLAITGTGSGAGTVVASDGTIQCTLLGANATGQCAATFAEGAIVQLRATASGGSAFQGWQGDCASSTGTTCTLTMDRARSAAARFIGSVALVVRGGGTGNGTVRSATAGILCAITAGTAEGTCSSSVLLGTTVTLSATAEPGHEFVGWSGPCVGTGVCTVTITAATDVRASFRGSASLLVRGTGSGAGTVQSSPAGIVCGINGTSTNGTCETTVPLGTTVTLAATPAPGSEFTGWSGACSGLGACTVVIDRQVEVRASFRGSVSLIVRGAGSGAGTVQSSPAGIACSLNAGTASGTCATGVPVGTAITLSAAATTGSEFVGWSGACTGSGSCTVTVNATTEVQAQFRQLNVPLTLTVSGPIGGSVQSSVGLSCATSGPPVTCTIPVPFGSVVRLTANPGPILRFSGFTGACDGAAPCDLVMTQPRSVNAAFTVRQATLSVVLSGGGTGAIAGTIGGDSFSCALTAGQGSRTCTQFLEAGRPVVMTAAPGANSVFAGWGGACSGLANCSLLADDVTVTASFDPIRAFVRVLRAEGAGGTGQVVFGPENNRCTITATGTTGRCLVEVAPNSSITFTIDPSVGFPFVAWGGACASFGANPVCTVTASGNIEVTVRFQSPSPD